MPGRDLKNYEQYRDKLLGYAQACEINVEYKPEDGDGAWISTRRKIRIDPDLAPSTEIATLLHELGHVLDDTRSKGGMDQRIEKAYHAVYHKKPTRKQHEMVLKRERAAWEHGRGIAKKLRIRLGKWFEDEMAEALREYRAQEVQNR
jgi:hypothetical protein